MLHCITLKLTIVNKHHKEECYSLASKRREREGEREEGRKGRREEGNKVKNMSDIFYG